MLGLNFTPLQRQAMPVARFGNSNPPEQPAVNPFATPPSHKPVGVGQTLDPTPVTLPKAILGIIKKEDSRAGLKMDIWTLFDPRNSQTYSAFLADADEEKLAALYQKLSQWGLGTPVKVEGIASKPIPQQRNPFLMISSIDRLA